MTELGARAIVRGEVTMRSGVVLALGLLLTGVVVAKDSGATISVDVGTPLKTLAARELQRYVYLRTGTLLTIAARDGETGSLVLRSDPALGPETYRLRTRDHALTISGGSDLAVLYGAYAVAEKLGIRFSLHGDTIPDQAIPFKMPQLDETHAPLFSTRGIQVFHDFPEGPDWWTVDDYKTHLAQMTKMRMNFIGMHTYPESTYGPEPLVWIGLPQDVNDDGTVKFSYPSHWATTSNSGPWGYEPTKTSDFSVGAGQLFAADEYGAPVMDSIGPQPRTPQESNLVFDRTGKFMHDVFSFGRSLGIRAAIGTETPLTVPQPLMAHLREQGLDPYDPATVALLYTGMFKRITKAMPVDFYWLYTPEDWLNGNDPSQTEATRLDVLAALAVLEAQGKPFELATSGWELGPKQDRALLDKLLPKEVTLSTINEDVGFAFLEPAYSRIENRRKWAIPWLEDDPGLTGPQFWAGRVRRDAADALAYGCDGLIGIVWRTRTLAPNVTALAQAGWDGQPWNPEFGKRVKSPAEPAPDATSTRPRDLPSDDLYLDWARTEFGPAVASQAAQLFTNLDGGFGDYSKPGYFKSPDGNPSTRMPRPGMWLGDGPGGIRPSATPWEKQKAGYAFVDEMEALRPRVKGAGALERFDYWLNTFKYLRAMGEIAATRGKLDAIIERIRHEEDPARYGKDALAEALPQRLLLARQWEQMMTYLLRTVSTSGEMGTIANLEQRSLRYMMFVNKHDITLSRWLGASLPKEAEPSKMYRDAARILVPTVRTIGNTDETLALRVIVLDRDPAASVVIRWRKLGRGAFQSVTAKALGRGVHEGTLPPLDATGIEYYVEASLADRKVLRWPATAPSINQTVVTLPET